MTNSLYCVLIALWLALAAAAVRDKTDETRLIEAMMMNYNPAARPVYNASHTVVVKFGITLTQISDMVSSLTTSVRTENPSDDLGEVTPMPPPERNAKLVNEPQGRGRRSVKNARPVPDEQRLMEMLLENYHRFSRPVINASLSVEVKFGITLVQISDM
ncbi:acetylcholine receptor subunit alpha-L1, partial [Biomphalaria glabrata]